jgi:hypothetical protein
LPTTKVTVSAYACTSRPFLPVLVEHLPDDVDDRFEVADNVHFSEAEAL